MKKRFLDFFSFKRLGPGPGLGRAGRINKRRAGRNNKRRAGRTNKRRAGSFAAAFRRGRTARDSGLRPAETACSCKRPLCLCEGGGSARALAGGFSMTELMTAAAVMTVMAAVGVSSYQTQKNKAAAQNAKRYLTTVYSAEQQFKETWGQYHENLSLVGAVPIGIITYDVGFGMGVTINQLSGLGIPADTDSKNYIKAEACSTWHGICGGGCETASTNIIGTNYFSCTLKLKDDAYNIHSTTKLLSDATNYDAKNTGTNAEFKAVARGYLSDEDVWSINQKQEIEHVKDGTK